MRRNQRGMNRERWPRPILKWAGGKTQILSELTDNAPEKFKTYFEPFFGGGAFFFHLYKERGFDEAVISDLNTDLISLYKIVKNNVHELIAELEGSEYENDKKKYYSARKEFNRAKSQGEQSVKQAARMVFLNRTCFNGLYRVNSRGEFNVPFGRYKNPQILDERNLIAVSLALSEVKILNVDFKIAVSKARKKDFVYFDPPYLPVSETAWFTAYTKDGFSLEEQERLSRVFRDLDNKGCFVLESNSAIEEIRELYEGYSIIEVLAARAISSNGSTRGKIPELLIMNYTPNRNQKDKQQDSVQSLLEEY